MAFAPREWAGQLKTADGGIDLFGYRLCVLDQLRRTIRRRDVFASRSLRYADPRKGLLSGAAWEAARPAVCRTVGRFGIGRGGTDPGFRRVWDLAYRETADRAPDNEALSIDTTAAGSNLSVANSTRSRSRQALSRSAPPSRPGCRRSTCPNSSSKCRHEPVSPTRFTHASEGGSRAADITTSVSAVLLAEACNTGFEPLLRRDDPALRRSRLSWVKQNFLRTETLTAANAALVAAQNAVSLAHSWGGGDVASADGLRFVVPVRTIHSGPNPHYLATSAASPGTIFRPTSSRPHAVTIPGTLRDSLYLLALVLEQETELSPTEIMTDTAGYTDSIFGIFHLLGYQFSPRIADIGGSRFWRVDKKADTACSTIWRRTGSICASSSTTGTIFCALPVR